MNAPRKIRLLVAIACYGTKNLPFLKKIIQAYQGMTMDVDIVVLSEAPKDLGAGIKVVVGLPSKNPWSLPFAHKAIFAENVDRYDLFAYSEDDMDVTEAHIQAFLDLTAVLPPNEIAGFLRYELAGTEKVLTDVHGSFHWKAESVRTRGEYTVAEFTNDHAGFYLLTQAQLKAAMASGGFMKAPYEGRYGLPETAATDPYTCCGMRKVICVSDLDQFLLHHMSNLYIARHGVALPEFREQVEALIAIRDGRHPASSLCNVDSQMPYGIWSKSYYEQYHDDFQVIAREAGSVLSVGCGRALAEVELMKRGVKVTALPLDSIVGARTAQCGIEVIYGTIQESLKKLQGRTFDTVLASNLLHLLPDPWAVLQSLAQHVRKGGTLAISGYNFDYIPDLARRLFGLGDYRKLKYFEQSGIHAYGAGRVTKQIQRAGLRVLSLRWFDHVRPQRLKRLRQRPGRFTARNWVIQAQQQS